MRVFRFVPLALAVLLTGCLGGDVGRVKDSKLKGWPQYTVGQLLDKRKACSNIEWESFTDTRDRKIVQYTCENELIGSFTKVLHERGIEREDMERRLFIESAKKGLEHAQRYVETAAENYQRQQDKVAQLQQGSGDGKAQALRADYGLLQRVNASTCGQADPKQFTHPDVQRIVDSMASDCRAKLRFEAACPDTLKADRARYLFCAQKYGGNGGLTPTDETFGNALSTIQRMVQSAEKSGGDKLRSELEYLAVTEESVRKSQVQLEAAQAKAEQAPNDPSLSRIQSNVDKLNRKLASFKTAREVSQWTVQDGEPVYLGSQIELEFSDRSLKEPLKAEYVFDHAAKDAGTVDDLHGYFRMQIDALWSTYELPAQ